MIVCICRRVSDRDIERHVRNGCASFDDLQIDSGVGACCGRCADCARGVFESACNSAAPHASSHRTIVPIALAA